MQTKSGRLLRSDRNDSLQVARAAEIELAELERAADEGDLSRRSPVMELWEVCGARAASSAF